MHYTCRIADDTMVCEITSDRPLAAPRLCFSGIAPYSVVSGGTLVQSTGFQLDGTEAWGIQDYNGQASSNGRVPSSSLDVGSHFTGSFDAIALLADDAASQSAESYFANIMIL